MGLWNPEVFFNLSTGLVLLRVSFVRIVSALRHGVRSNSLGGKKTGTVPVCAPVRFFGGHLHLSEQSNPMAHHEDRTGHVQTHSPLSCTRQSLDDGPSALTIHSWRRRPI